MPRRSAITRLSTAAIAAAAVVASVLVAPRGLRGPGDEYHRRGAGHRSEHADPVGPST